MLNVRIIVVPVVQVYEKRPSTHFSDSCEINLLSRALMSQYGRIQYGEVCGEKGGGSCFGDRVCFVD